MRASTRALCALFVATLCAGCVAPEDQPLDDQDPHQPGEALGAFSVTGKLGDDTCGADSLAAPSKWVFDVKLSREGSTLYWLNGREAITGDIDNHGRFGFDTHIDLPISAEHGAYKGCTIVRTDSATGTLASDADAFTGTLSYSYAQSPSSDCSALPLGSGGLPLALPCSLAYGLSGARVSNE
jgi:hypothetical protein